MKHPTCSTKPLLPALLSSYIVPGRVRLSETAVLPRYAVLLLLLAPLYTHAALSGLRWRADIPDTKPYTAEIRRGETITLTATLHAYNQPLALPEGIGCTLYYQTNGMNTLWWPIPGTATTNGTLSALWTPAHDCGAASYTFFLAAEQPTDAEPLRLYRAHGTLRLLPSPGATPNELPLPVRTLDFATVEIHNPPWPDPATTPSAADLQAATNTLATTLQAATNTLANDLQAHTTNTHIHLSPAQSNRIDQAVLGADIPDYLRALPDVRSWSFMDDGGSHHVEFTPMGLILHNLSTASSSHILRGLIRISDFYDTYGADFLPEGLKNLSTGHLYPYPTSPSSPLATHYDIDTATNHLIQTWVLTTNSWLTVSNNVLTVYYVDDTSTTNAIWSSSESSGTPETPPGIDPSATNLLWQALDTKAPKAWGNYAPDGSVNPDPDYMLYINKPATMFASGFEWATHGSYAVLATSGAVAFLGGDSGEVRFGTDLHDNWFGIQAGGSLVIGARTDSISHDLASQTVTMTYDYTGSQPQLYFAPTLTEGLMGFSLQTDGVLWSDNGDGTWTVIAPATTPRGFWYATTTVQVDSYFVTKMPARFDGGIMGGTNDAPVFPNTVIEIQQGGKTYRIPAQEISP